MSNPDPWVWAEDVVSGHHLPVLRAAAEADPKRYKIDEKHAVRDAEGNLLGVVFNSELGESKPAAKTTPVKES